MLHFPRDQHRREWAGSAEGTSAPEKGCHVRKEPGLQGFLEGGVTGFILCQPLSGLSECCP